MRASPSEEDTENRGDGPRRQKTGPCLRHRVRPAHSEHASLGHRDSRGKEPEPALSRAAGSSRTSLKIRSGAGDGGV